MSLILFWAEVEEEEDDENSIFSGLMKREKGEEESSLLSGLMKMEEDEEKRRRLLSSRGVIARDEEGSDLCWEMVSDHRGWAKTRSRPHHQRIIGGQA